MKYEIIDNRTRKVYHTDSQKQLAKVIRALVSKQGECSVSIHELTCPKCESKMQTATLGFSQRNDFIFGYECTNPNCRHQIRRSG